MLRSLSILLIILMVSLACTLTSAENKAPTNVPIVVQNPQFPTATATLQSSAVAPVLTATVASPLVNTPVTLCTPRNDWLAYTVVAGDTVSSLAQRSNSTVETLVAANCLADASTIIVGQVLRVPMMPISLPSATSQATCTRTWFFTFNQGKRDTLNACPGELFTVQAIGQDFEGGRVYRYDALPGSSDTRGTIYIIYNDGTWETYVDTWDSSQIASDPSIIPPAERYQPTQAIGKVWRDNPSVRAKLGWAYENAALFSGRFQQPVNPSGAWPSNNVYWYLDHGKWGIVLRLVSVNNGPNTWEAVGGY